MIGNQRVEELAAKIRSGRVRIDLDQVRIRSPKGPKETVTYPFFLEIEKGEFICRWRVPLGEKPTPVMASLMQRPRSMVGTAADNFRLSAVTDDGIAIEINDLSPMPSSITRDDGPSSYSTRFSVLDIPARGDEMRDLGQIIEHLNRLNLKPGEELSPPTSRKKEEMLFAVIPNVSIRIVTDGVDTVITHPLLGERSKGSSNCHVGDVHNGKFCIEAKDGDLWVYYRRIVEDQERNPSAKTVFEGLLSAIGFTHGCHPWPYYYHHVRDHVVVERWVRCCPDCARDVLLPIKNRSLLRSQDERDLFRAAVLFFATKSKEATVATRALWLMRESNRESMPFEIRLLVLCSILEGIVHRSTNALLSEDERSRDKPRKDKWRLLVERLSLPWDIFEAAFESWSFYRHPLAHGFQERSDEAPETAFDAYSRITGVIYIFMAKAMGFTGTMPASPLEDKTVSLSAPIAVRS